MLKVKAYRYSAQSEMWSKSFIWELAKYLLVGGSAASERTQAAIPYNNKQ